MKAVILTLLAAVGAAVAQKTFADYNLPECSIDCLNKAVDSATPCKPNDLDCFCIADNYRATYDAAVGCVLQKCGQDVAIGQVLPAAAKLCEEVAGPYTETWSDGQAVPVTPAPTADATGSGVATTTAAATTTTAVATSTPASGVGRFSVGLGAVVPFALAVLF
ncbi:hypothetical protein QBC47DRAFT_120750 [Echria macrotheca]|uniref:CFEM domain-containing protein n=1 Tax=Echria macrotheca TaxID=438768 RepID=A0AAJ0B2I3_9PEZI|nr:hypothetical protein QBC47DRAFT_120750 [Echria macrotheca]